MGFFLGFILLLIKNLNDKGKIKAGAACFLGPAGNDRNRILPSSEAMKAYENIYHVGDAYERNVKRGCVK